MEYDPGKIKEEIDNFLKCDIREEPRMVLFRELLSGDNLRIIKEAVYFLGGECPLSHIDSPKISKLEKLLEVVK